MEKRKNKKKLFAIIAGSALAFVLTIALSVSITLAYFGETETDSTSVTMGGAVYISADGTPAGDGITMSTPLKDILPGQAVEVTATVSLITSADAEQKAFIAVKPSFSVPEGETDDDVIAELETLTDELELQAAEGTAISRGTWVLYEGWYFLCSEGTGANGVLVPVELDGTNAVTVVAKASGVAPVGLSNISAMKTINAKFDVVAVQGVAFNGTGGVISNAKISDALVMFNQINSAIPYTPAP